MNWLKFLVALAALTVAGCAAYFSVTGLGILFSGSSVSVMIMASALEFSKLIAATYLKQVWDKISGFLKFYFVSAVIILMLITSAGIFGYLSNAFQQQNLVIQQVDRDIAVWETKIQTNESQIKIFNEQLSNLQQNQGKIIDLQQGKDVNNRLLKSVDARDGQINDVSEKLDKLNSEISMYNDTINKIKILNIEVEREVGGFRFVAESFGVDLNTVVKFFIFLIVFVFDPMAIALVIAFNNLLKDESIDNKKKSVKIDETIEPKVYELYGDTESSVSNVIETEFDDEIVETMEKNEINVQNLDVPDEGIDDLDVPDEAVVDLDTIVPVNTPSDDKFEDEPAEIIQIATSTPVVDENYNWTHAYNGSPYYTNPNFPWDRKNLWQNDNKAVQYWLTQKGGRI